MSSTYGESVAGLAAGGRPGQTGVFNEHEVRAATGVTLALGAFAFVHAYFAKEYAPIKIVTALFFVEFALRVTAGSHRSPIGRLAKLLTRRRPPHWVSAQPKRFAWSLGLALSLAMTVITNLNVRGALPLTICLACMALMWLEAVSGLCIGCEIYGRLIRRGWIAQGAANALCSDGSCDTRDERT
ncbi:MAG: hypothetical protein OHK0044_27830 [Burkholderiaceae bacterium]